MIYNIQEHWPVVTHDWVLIMSYILKPLEKHLILSFVVANITVAYRELWNLASYSGTIIGPYFSLDNYHRAYPWESEEQI